MLRPARRGAPSCTSPSTSAWSPCRRGRRRAPRRPGRPCRRGRRRRRPRGSRSSCPDLETPRRLLCWSGGRVGGVSFWMGPVFFLFFVRVCPAVTPPHPPPQKKSQVVVGSVFRPFLLLSLCLFPSFCFLRSQRDQTLSPNMRRPLLSKCAEKAQALESISVQMRKS